MPLKLWILIDSININMDFIHTLQFPHFQLRSRISNMKMTKETKEATPYIIWWSYFQPCSLYLFLTPRQSSILVVDRKCHQCLLLFGFPLSASSWQPPSQPNLCSWWTCIFKVSKYMSVVIKQCKQYIHLQQRTWDCSYQDFKNTCLVRNSSLVEWVGLCDRGSGTLWPSKWTKIIN